MVSHEDQDVDAYTESQESVSSDLETVGEIRALGTIEHGVPAPQDVMPDIFIRHPVVKPGGCLVNVWPPSLSPSSSFVSGKEGERIQLNRSKNLFVHSLEEMDDNCPENEGGIERTVSEDKSPPFLTSEIYAAYFELVGHRLFVGDRAWKLEYSPFRKKLFDIFELLSWTSNVTTAIHEINALFPTSPKDSAIYLGLWNPEWNVELPDAERYRPEVFERFFWEDLFWWFIHRGYKNDRLQNTLFDFIRKIKETNVGTIVTDVDGTISVFETSPSFPLCLDISMKAYEIYSQQDWGKTGERACLTASVLYARLACSHMSTRAFVWGYALLAEFAEDMNQLCKLGHRFLMIRAKSLYIMLSHAGMELHKYVSDMKDKPIDAQIHETPGHDFEVSRLSTWLKWSAAIDEHSLNTAFQPCFRLCCIEINHLMKQLHIRAQWIAVRSTHYSL